MSTRIFEIKTLKSVIVKNLFEVIKPYIKETNILINKDCIKISTMDTSKVSLTYVKLDANKFESYQCSKAVVIGIDTNTFFKTIKSANRRETITLYMNADEEDKLGIELADPFMGKIKDYKIPLLVLDDKVINISEMMFDYVINMPSIQFQQIIKDIQLLEGKVVEIKSIGKQLIFSCDDGLADFKTAISEIDDKLNKDQKTLLQQNGEDIRSIKFEKTHDKIVQGKFKLSHLMNFIKASHLCENMNILLTNDKPLILEYFVADLGVLRFLLMGHID
jgi:proliferating cell nuclear antigen|uniref:Proliferating cell nuclear antigen PCNA N-terminal domain-containing protein n=1 Tax=viral metagenome TaxID=1070528 RepID=A0A6C0AL84_9ZZZZ